MYIIIFINLTNILTELSLKSFVLFSSIVFTNLDFLVMLFAKLFANVIITTILYILVTIFINSSVKLNVGFKNKIAIYIPVILKNTFNGV